jgi:hypothetical protein
MAWRHRGALHLTAIVKATFAITPDGRMTLAAPEDLAPRDRVPFRPQADVLLTGSASQGASARLAVRREQVLVDKVGTPSGFGPVAMIWPVGFDQGIPEIPADVDWTAFQAAPPDQRADFLHGDEWILLEGLHPVLARVVAQLPHVRAEGGVYGPLTPGGPDQQPLELDADVLHVDARRLVCTVTWRAAMPVAGERELAGLSLAMGVTIGGEPITVLEAEDAAPTREIRAAPPARSLEGTLDLSAAAVEQAMREASELPFGRGKSPAAEPSADLARAVPAIRRAPRSFEGTLDLTGFVNAAPSAPAWLAPPGKTDDEPAPATVQLPGLLDRPVEETVQFTRELASSTRAPFPIAAPAAALPAEAPVAATPWAPAPIARAPRPSSAFEGTLDLTPRPLPAPPPLVTPPPAPPIERAPEPPIERAPEPLPPPPPPPEPPRAAERASVWAAPEPSKPEPPPPPRPRPPPGPDLNAGLYNRFTKKK